MTDDSLKPHVHRNDAEALWQVMSLSGTHRNLLAWQEAMTLVEKVYRDTDALPRHEWFGLRAQIRRAAVSVPSNIAEGAARSSPAELVHFLSIACGSLAELETQLELAIRLGYLRADVSSILQSSRVGMLLRTLRKSRKEAANAIKA
jgi:four helix bundle protein